MYQIYISEIQGNKYKFNLEYNEKDQLFDIQCATINDTAVQSPRAQTEAFQTTNECIEEAIKVLNECGGARLLNKKIKELPVDVVMTVNALCGVLICCMGMLYTSYTGVYKETRSYIGEIMTEKLYTRIDQLSVFNICNSGEIKRLKKEFQATEQKCLPLLKHPTMLTSRSVYSKYAYEYGKWFYRFEVFVIDKIVKI